MKQKVITKVLNVSEKTKNMMIEYFNDYKREKTPPYAIFQADDGGTVVTLYNSGKCVFQGFDADLSSLFWIETEKINSGSAQVTSSSDKKNEEKKERRLPLRISSIGSDEVGTGDYFGPMVVTASYVSKEDIDFLLELKVKDSKKLTDNDILKIVPKIIERIKEELDQAPEGGLRIIDNNGHKQFYRRTEGGKKNEYIRKKNVALAKELAPSNIQVNAIACGLIDTDMNSCFSEEEISTLIEEIPAGRIGTPEEVAGLAFSLSKEHNYLTGQVISLDGGWI